MYLSTIMSNICSMCIYLHVHVLMKSAVLCKQSVTLFEKYTVKAHTGTLA